MPSLNKLPTEIIDQILKHLRPLDELPHPSQETEEAGAWDIRHSARTLSAVARTCRDLHPIAERVLYSRYEIRFRKPLPDFAWKIATNKTLHTALRRIDVLHDGIDVPSEGNTQDVSYSPSVELAMVVLQAPNLRRFFMDADHKAYVTMNEPLWLRPIVTAARMKLQGQDHNDAYSMLHTIDVRLHNKVVPSLLYLFALPRLRKLSLRSAVFGPSKEAKWPEIPTTSMVTTLELEGEAQGSVEWILRMIRCCRTLHCFSATTNHEGQPSGSSLQWFTDIFAALHGHKDTLTDLTLRPCSDDSFETLDCHYNRLEGFEAFSALKALKVPFQLLMGRPKGWLISDGHFVTDSHEDWTGYPVMRHILPPKLNTLSLALGDTISPGRDYEHILLDLVPEAATGGAGPTIHTLNVAYSWLDDNNIFPLNFWTLEDKLVRRGCSFKYILMFDDDAMGVGAHRERKFKRFAKKLATAYGPKAIEMALHLDSASPTLPRMIMDALSLQRDWLMTDQADTVLFGQEVDYDAVDERFQEPEASEEDGDADGPS